MFQLTMISNPFQPFFHIKLHVLLNKKGKIHVPPARQKLKVVWQLNERFKLAHAIMKTDVDDWKVPKLNAS